MPSVFLPNLSKEFPMLSQKSSNFFPRPAPWSVILILLSFASSEILLYQNYFFSGIIILSSLDHLSTLPINFNPLKIFKNRQYTFPPSPQYWNSFFKSQKWPGDWQALPLCLIFISATFDIITQTLLFGDIFLWYI